MFRVRYNDFNGEAHVEIVKGTFDDLGRRIESLHLSGCENIETEVEEINAA